MRGGGCTVQQSLTPEALRVVRQAVALAQQRGHAQVTPLHVAAVLLSSPASLLRAACLECHSHPLRCKALELCFNVALNRLPASSSSPWHHHHGHGHRLPALSNALVAAFKRTQAHQRRGGSGEAQAAQQLLAVKVELPQVVLSILDDPSVSRVMREAGFSSTQVKANVEKAVSNLDIDSSSSPPPLTKRARSSSSSIEDEALDSLLRLRRKKSSIVIVGESLAAGEAFLRRLIQASKEFDAAEAVRDLQLANVSLSSGSSWEEAEERIKDLSDLIAERRSRSTVIYTGDVERIAGECSELSGRGGGCDEKYSSLKHEIMELGRLVSNGEGRIWVMGFARYECYMRCISWFASHLGSTVDVQPLFVLQAGSSLDLSLGLNRLGNPSHERQYHQWSFPSSSSSETHENKLGFESSSQLHHQKEQRSSPEAVEYASRFKELSAENLKALSAAMEERVPWQKHIAAGIAGTVLRCRSGMMRKRKAVSEPAASSRATWLLFRGGDREGKAGMAMELARLVFGSCADFAAVRCGGRRYLERLSEAVRVNCHRVILMEGVEQAEEGMESAIGRGRIEVGSNAGEEAVSVGDAIIIFTCDHGFESASGEEEEEEELQDPRCSFVLDLNVCADCCGGMERISELVDGTFIFDLPQIT